MSRPHSIKPWIGIVLVIVAIGAVAYVLMYRGPADLADRVEQTANRGADNALDKVERLGDMAARAGEKLGESLGVKPRIIVNGEVIAEATASINELATSEKTFKQKFQWEHTYLRSTKQIEVEATFTAKAGYKLDKLPELEFNAEGDELTARLPDPVILSIEQSNFRILEDKSGMWNRLKKEDREHAQNELKRLAASAAHESDLLEQADEHLIDHIRESIETSSDSEVTIHREALNRPPLVDRD